MASKLGKKSKSGPSKVSSLKSENIRYPDEFYMQISYGLMVCVLGIIWMSKEVGWIQTQIPIGPLIIIIFGMMIMFARVKQSAN